MITQAINKYILITKLAGQAQFSQYRNTGSHSKEGDELLNDVGTWHRSKGEHGCIGLWHGKHGEATS